MAEQEKLIHKLDDYMKKMLFGLTPFSIEQTSELCLIDQNTRHAKELPKWAQPLFRIRPFSKAERSEAIEANTEEKRTELARKVTKGWSCLFDCATGNEIVYKSCNVDGGADATSFGNLPDVTRMAIFGHSFLISGLSATEKTGLK